MLGIFGPVIDGTCPRGAPCGGWNAAVQPDPAVSMDFAFLNGSQNLVALKWLSITAGAAA
jgi:hypothetical protein